MARKQYQPYPGKIVIISSPSGGGKTSICRGLLTPSRKRLGWDFSVSYTTRARRKGERNKREYHFVTDSQFDKLVAKNAFAEHFRVHLYKYGTPRQPLEEIRRSGGVMLLDVDVQGAKRLKEEYPGAITIFVLPPSVRALRQRLKKRGTETNDQLQVRFENAKQEMRSFTRFGFDYVVINKELKAAIREVDAIIHADHCRLDRIDREQLRRIVGSR